LAARCHPGERPGVLARVRREAELDPIEPARSDVLDRRLLDGDLEAGPLHPELSQLALRLPSEPFRRGAPPVRERYRRLRELHAQLAEHPLLLGQELLVTTQAVELDRRILPDREHRRPRVTAPPPPPPQRAVPPRRAAGPRALPPPP